MINEIKKHFKDNLNIDLKEFIADSKRKELCYKAINIIESSKCKDIKDSKKYKKLVEILKEIFAPLESMIKKHLTL